MADKNLTVIDFFSGAGGFSEGFRQQGFRILKGVDFWEPAVLTHNLNHGLNDKPENVLDYYGHASDDVDRINSLPDTDVIIGSPSCVTFSMSNKGGKADKTEGLKLIFAYLRIIAVKKHQPNSTLRAWLMENVPNSGNYVQKTYTFTELNLKNWAIKVGLDPTAIALTLNGTVLNASDYGAPQKRNRFICGESVVDGTFPLPELIEHGDILLKDIKSKMPKPSLRRPSGSWTDPNYPSLSVMASELSDHFYDTGLYAAEWEQSRNLKTMHPFMGKMSFPEDENRSARTITATRSISSRESHVYKSEHVRTGHGEYRTPTIREAASLMGYPYTYQFFGSEGMKWKLIGNSVSPQVSSALAKAILLKQGLTPVPLSKVSFDTQLENYLQVDNLNTYGEASFDKPKQRRPEARFRRCIFKGQNMTIDLLNYHPETKKEDWCVAAFYGTGTNHRYDILTKKLFAEIRDAASNEFSLFDNFISEIHTALNGLSVKPNVLQKVYVEDYTVSLQQNPVVIVRELEGILKKYSALAPQSKIALHGMTRESYSFPQLLGLFSLGHIIYNEPQSQMKLGETGKTLSYEPSTTD